PARGRSLNRGSGFLELHFQAQALELLDEHVERFGHAGLRRILALDDGLVDARTAGDVVALDCQQLLERVGGAIGLERPHLHLAEAPEAWGHEAYGAAYTLQALLTDKSDDVSG